MQTQISMAKKIIIVILSNILIVALFITYGLIPSMDREASAIAANSRAKRAQQEMDNLLVKIERTHAEADENKTTVAEYKSHLMVYSAVEDIEEDFTKALLDKNLSPLVVKITSEATSASNPFKKFTVDINVSGSLQGIISMCGYIDKEFSYNLTDLRIAEEQASYKATMKVLAVYVEEEGDPQNEE